MILILAFLLNGCSSPDTGDSADCYIYDPLNETCDRDDEVVLGDDASFACRHCNEEE